MKVKLSKEVVICFQISIFEPLETTPTWKVHCVELLWFAFKLVSLNHWKQLWDVLVFSSPVVICFQISIFEPLETTREPLAGTSSQLWFAFKLVSLNHWKQLLKLWKKDNNVVICFQISIFEPLETTRKLRESMSKKLWFAFKLVSLNHWKQLKTMNLFSVYVVICFQISIFEPLETTLVFKPSKIAGLWFAFKLVSLNHWKQLQIVVLL